MIRTSHNIDVVLSNSYCYFMNDKIYFRDSLFMADIKATLKSKTRNKMKLWIEKKAWIQIWQLEGETW